MDDLGLAWQHYIRSFETYLKLEKRLADLSVQAYLRDVEHLKRYAIEQQLAPSQVTVEVMQHLLAELNDMGIAATTQSRMISGWRTFFQMAVVEDELPDNPAKQLQMPLRPRLLPDVLTDNEISAIQATFDRSLPDQERNYVIVEVLYGCGLRVSELVNLKLSNVYDDEECLRVMGKGEKERWVPINKRALNLLLDYVRLVRSQQRIRPGEENYVFLNRLGTHLSRNYVFMFLQQAARTAGIAKHVSPHSLRHSFATELVQNGADLRAVQEMLGHAKLGTTEIYTHLDSRFLRETIECYHPHYKR